MRGGCVCLGAMLTIAVCLAMANCFDAFIKLLPMTKVTLAIFVGNVWSFGLKTCMHLERDYRGAKVEWWQQHTTPMYFFFCITLICELFTFWGELHAPDQESAGISNNCMTTWREAQVLDESHHSLYIYRVASVAPIFATFTVLVGAFATFRHVRRARRQDLWDTNRGTTLWILQLPVAYSLTALFSVEKGLKQARTGAHMCNINDDSLKFYMEAGLSFGDAYEAIALLLFANITLNVIENTVDKVVLDAESIKKAFASVEAAVTDKLTDDDPTSFRREFHLLTEANTKVMTRLEQISEKLLHSTWTLSTLGMQYFAFTCLIISAPQILACKAKVSGYPGMYEALKGFSDRWAVTFKGMGLVGSCIAIHNMVSIESNFDRAFLHGFTAKLKFISVKIMVSIVFIQQCALPVVFHLTPDRASLLDASLRVIEFTFLAIFNLWAWPLDQHFYSMEAMDIEGMEDVEEDLIRDGMLGSLSDVLGI